MIAWFGCESEATKNKYLKKNYCIRCAGNRKRNIRTFEEIRKN